jgi:hypothetical protein
MARPDSLEAAQLQALYQREEAELPVDPVAVQAAQQEIVLESRPVAGHQWSDGDECRHWSKALTAVLRYDPYHGGWADLDEVVGRLHFSRRYGAASKDIVWAVLLRDAGRRFEYSMRQAESGWWHWGLRAAPRRAGRR